MSELVHLHRKLVKAFHIAACRAPGDLRSRYEINAANDGKINFIDIGAAGQLPPPWVNNADRIKLLLTFEPNGGAETSGNVIHLDDAVWERNESREFFVYGTPGDAKRHGSSLFEQNVEYVQENWEWLRKLGPSRLAQTWLARSELQDTVVIDCRTLDAVLEDRAPTVPFHFAKIDVQGAELPILRGAMNFLTTSCVGLQLELFKLPLYKGAPLIDEVREFLDELGFDLVHADRAHGTFDSQHECVFLHRSRSPEIRAEIADIYGLPAKVVTQ